jgi:hypothetical protein
LLRGEFGPALVAELDHKVAALDIAAPYIDAMRSALADL